MLKKKSFLERLTGNIRLEDDQEESSNQSTANNGYVKKLNLSDNKGAGMPESKDASGEKTEDEAELTVDVYQTPNEIVIQTMVAGVQPENLSINITRDVVTIRGKREENRSVSGDNYSMQELYWGAFSRTINLPEEIDPEGAEAIERHGLLIIKLPKVDKNKETKLKVRSI